jgi:hypothetical protein
MTSKNIYGFDPKSIPGLQLWLDAADANTLFSNTGGTTPATVSGTIGMWKDKSAYARHYTSSNPPTYSATGAITFYNGTAMFNSATWSGNGAGVDMFVVSTPWDYTVYNDWRTLFRGASLGHRVIIVYNSQQLGFYDNYNGYFQFGSLTLGQTQSLLYVSVDSSFKASAALNGTAAVSAAGSTENSDSQPFYCLGAYQGLSQPWGVINEVLIYSNVTPAQRQQIEGYLAWKWELYIEKATSIPGCVFWLDASDDSSFTYSSGTSVSVWQDKIGAKNLVPAFSGYNPTRVGNAVFFNNDPNASYSGGNSYVLYYPSTWYLPSENVSVFVVSTPTATDAGNGYRSMLILQSANGSSSPPNILIEMEYAYYYGSPSHEGNEYFTDYDGANWANAIIGNPVVKTPNVIRLDTLIGGRSAPALYTNGIQNSYQVYTQATGSTYTNYPIVYTIVGGAGYYSPLTGGGREYTGYIHEIIVYSSVLTAVQRQQVENYLTRKWSIPSISSNMLPSTHSFSQIKPHSRRPFHPVDIKGCVVWLDGNDTATVTFASSNNVSTWKDKSGHGYTASIYAVGYSTYNYLSPVYQNGGLYFNNTAYYANMSTGSMYGLVIPYTSGLTINQTNITVFMVTKPDYSKGFYAAPVCLYTSGGGSGYWSALNLNQSTYPTEYYIDYPIGPGGGYFAFYNTVLTTKSITTFTVSSSAAYIYENGAVDQSTTYSYSSPYTTANDLNVGGTTNRGFPGYIYEVVVYNTALADSDRQQVEGYLAWKWGITLPSGHNFYTSAPGAVLPFIPKNIMYPSIWLDAMDPDGTGVQPSNSTSIQTWIDKSGNGNNMVTNNGTPTFYQNPSSIYLNGSSSLINTSFTSQIYILFIVYKKTSTYGALYTTDTNSATSYTGLFPTEGSTTYFDSGAAWYSQATTIPDSTQNILTIQYTSAGAGANMYVWLNGTLNISTTAAGDRVINSLILGVRNSSGWNGYITGNYYEVIQYSSNFTTTQRQKIEGYLAWKWGLSKNLPNTHPYYSYAPANTEDFAILKFSYTGADQTWTVPAGLTSVNVVLYGAGGENGYWDGGTGNTGGPGGYVSGVLAVTPGETLTIIVGQGPVNQYNSIYYGYSESGSGGSYGGGGSRGYYSYAGAGGGRSAIQRSGVDIVTAGGGGGGAYYGVYAGAGGGSTGGTGGNGGSGGTQSYGGTGTNGGGTGTQYNGGGPGDYNYTGGGGGGWWGGGGGGYYYMAGGGGSSYVANLTGTVTDTQGGGSPAQTNGSVLIYI